MPYDNQGNWVQGGVPQGNPFSDMFNSTGSYSQYAGGNTGGWGVGGAEAFGNAWGGQNEGPGPMQGSMNPHALKYDNIFDVDTSFLDYTPTGLDFSIDGADGADGKGGTPRTKEDYANKAAGISMMVSGAADWFGSKKRMGVQQGLADAAKLDIDQFRDDATAGKYDAKTNKQKMDSVSFGRQDLDINPSLSMAATTMDNMSTDPRMMASTLGSMNTSNTKSMQNLQQTNLQNELANTQRYGDYMGGLQTQNEGFQRGLATDKFQDDKLAFSTATDNKMMMDEKRRQGIANVVGGGLQYFSEQGMKIPEFQEGGDVMQQILAAQGEGGIPPRQDLPGEESHEANPISMVAPDGEVVGEATGGEIILNGEQTEDIENAVAMVDQAVESGQEPSMEALMALYEAVSKTLSQPQFQDGEQQESSSPEQERMMAMLDGGQQMA
jgi:hypothetical protein